MTDESLAPFNRIRRRLPRKQRPHESSSKANRQLVKRNPPSSSGGTALRISSPNTSTQNETNRQLVKRNSPSSSGGTDKSSSKANRQLVKRNSPSSSGGTDLRISSPNTSTRNGIKPIDSWSRGIRRRLLVEPTFESSRQHESSSKTNRQLVKRNPPSSSGGTDLRISST
ncbi:unnamed protein product [Protopolystoma xenopodis]|uniref:Uncharacterized protein n=1 Tax=Protopolystoma xenopodis TaxID=117903 RepID=A0A3S5A6S3_9PLAT|nr:unnamed protein product [Protopolystoma xenopodis]